jgi:hypothetical protein
MKNRAKARRLQRVSHTFQGAANSTRNWAAAFEGVQYQVGDVIRRAGGLNANYVSVELRFGW